MAEINCACRSRDAHDCWALRYHGHTGVSELTVDQEGGPCECVCHETEEDDGFCCDTPEFLVDCEACDGKGYIAKTIHVYEPGCGFSHPDVEERPCEACGGNGWFVCEAE